MTDFFDDDDGWGDIGNLDDPTIDEEGEEVSAMSKFEMSLNSPVSTHSPPSILTPPTPEAIDIPTVKVEPSALAMFEMSINTPPPTRIPDSVPLRQTLTKPTITKSAIAKPITKPTKPSPSTIIAINKPIAIPASTAAPPIPVPAPSCWFDDLHDSDDSLNKTVATPSSVSIAAPISAPISASTPSNDSDDANVDANKFDLERSNLQNQITSLLSEVSNLSTSYTDLRANHEVTTKALNLANVNLKTTDDAKYELHRNYELFHNKHNETITALNDANSVIEGNKIDIHELKLRLESKSNEVCDVRSELNQSVMLVEQAENETKEQKRINSVLVEDHLNTVEELKSNITISSETITKLEKELSNRDESAVIVNNSIISLNEQISSMEQIEESLESKILLIENERDLLGKGNLKLKEEIEELAVYANADEEVESLKATETEVRIDFESLKSNHDEIETVLKSTIAALQLKLASTAQSTAEEASKNASLLHDFDEMQASIMNLKDEVDVLGRTNDAHQLQIALMSESQINLDTRLHLERTQQPGIREEIEVMRRNAVEADEWMIQANDRIIALQDENDNLQAALTEKETQPLSPSTTSSSSNFLSASSPSKDNARIKVLKKKLQKSELGRAEVLSSLASMQREHANNLQMLSKSLPSLLKGDLEVEEDAVEVDDAVDLM